jgi:5-methylcytosine-specific restriction endonuclease McrA
MRFESFEEASARMPGWFDAKERVDVFRENERGLVDSAMQSLRFPHAPLGRHCHFCPKGFTRPKEAVLVFFGAAKLADKDSAVLRYPMYYARGLLTHLECGPDVGYNIHLNHIVEPGDRAEREGTDDLLGWMRHLAEKNWGADVEADLRAAHELAVLLSKGNAVVTSREAALAYRALSISSNSRTAAPSLRAHVLERDHFRCRRCGAIGGEAQLVVDHVVPFSAGGLTELKNLQTLCRECNAGKAARAPHPHDLRT